MPDDMSMTGVILVRSWRRTIYDETDAEGLKGRVKREVSERLGVVGQDDYAGSG